MMFQFAIDFFYDKATFCFTMLAVITTGAVATPFLAIWSANKITEAVYEIERLREALKDINGQMRQADRYLLKESTLAALKEGE
jgi:CHASE3 domain sensor protein